MSELPLVLICSANVTCIDLRQSIMQYPHFFQEILLHYNLHALTRKKFISITADHAIASNIVMKLLEKYPETKNVYLHFSEAKNLVKEIVENTIAFEINDIGEMLNTGQIQTIICRKHVSKAMITLPNARSSRYSASGNLWNQPAVSFLVAVSDATS
jgi:hypothetical protein